ncbi:MAG TPA: adenylate/guanylate cyclase domain-containing protein [Kiloniellales bacterium]|nr:adenylate/guanylate cyclase domain-containing protein [Kiloniellales bacterium]
MNEAARLPKHEIEEIPQADGSVRYFGRARVGPVALHWEERPVNWVANRWYVHRRDFLRGPLRILTARLTLEPDGQGCRADYRVEAAPANLLGRLMLGTRFFESAGRTFGDLAADAERYLTGESPMIFDYRPPPVAAELRARIETIVTRIEESGRGHGLAARLAGLVLNAQEVDLIHLRPLRLARDWGVPERTAVELCLEAVRAGLLRLRWDLLCPRCRVAKDSVVSLDRLPKGAHCGTCNIDYEQDFSRNVELSFEPAPAVRRLEAGEYCLFGPMSTPHVWVQITLAPGESRSLVADLPPGRYRLRTLEPGPEIEVDYEATDGAGFPEWVLENDGIAVGVAAEPGRVRLTNRSVRRLTAIMEELQWVRDALTADRVTAMQAFRELFSDQVLRPGDEVSIRRTALMFTDLSASTRLYSEIGDGPAYHLVREHFAFLAGIVREHDGAIVKTIGDAIMAAFADPVDALAAALEIQRRIAEFNDRSDSRPLAIKLGLHEGPTIAVTLNERLDYFGTTVNMAARLQAESRGGDIVLSREFAADPAVAERLSGLAMSSEAVRLKGFDEPVEFLRLLP